MDYKTIGNHVTEQGDGTPSSGRTRSCQAGSSRPSSCDREASLTSLVGNQAEVFIATGKRKEMEDKKMEEVFQVDTGFDEQSHFLIEDRSMDPPRGRGGREEIKDFDPFKRRDSITRSPPRPRLGNTTARQRSGSCSGIFLAENKASKRRREEETENSSNIEDSREITDLIRKLTEDAMALHSEVETTYKPKKEFKYLANSIVLLAKKLDRVMQDVLPFIVEKRGKTENVNKTSESRKTVEMSTQTVGEDISEEEQAAEEIAELIASEMLPEKIEELIKRQWPETAYKKTAIERKSILNATGDVVLVADFGEASERRLCKRMAERNCYMKQMLEEKKPNTGSIVHLTSATRVRIDNEDVKDVAEQSIFLVGVSEEEGNIKYQKTLDALIKLKKDAETKERRTLSVAILNNNPEEINRKILECAFGDSKIEVVLYNPSRTSANTKREAQRGTNDTTDVIISKTDEGMQSTKNRLKRVQVGEVNKRKKLRQEALLVKMPNTSYAELLKTVKQTINPSGIGVDIKDIRKTKSGELLVTVQNGAEKLEALKNEINNKLPKADTTHLTTRKVLHVKDLDEVTTIEEIREAISSAIAVKPESIEVRALRPAYASRQNVTVVLSETDAEKLTKMGKIRIGWTRCRILERKADLKCYRCWEYGHTKSQCKGPDREHLCLRCSQEGHKASECSNVAYCVHCKKGGHQSGNPKCPTNRDVRKSEASRRLGGKSND